MIQNILTVRLVNNHKPQRIGIRYCLKTKARIIFVKQKKQHFSLILIRPWWWNANPMIWPLLGILRIVLTRWTIFFFTHAMNYIKSHVKYFYFYNLIVEGGETWTLDIEVRKYKNVLVELQGSWLSHVKYEIKLNYQQI